VVIDLGTVEYSFNLSYAAGDCLIFSDENCQLQTSYAAASIDRKAGHREATLVALAEGGNSTARKLLSLLTSATRTNFTTPQIHREFGPFLLRLYYEEPMYYRRIVKQSASSCRSLTISR